MDIKKELPCSKIYLIVLVAMFSEPSRVTQSWTKDFFFSLLSSGEWQSGGAFESSKLRKSRIFSETDQ